MKIETEELSKTLDDFIDTVDSTAQMLSEIVSQITSGLDEIMNKINSDIVLSDVEVPTETLERYFLELSNAVYFVASKVEFAGIYDSMSKLSYKTEYNNNYLNPSLEKAKPTVAELTASAENDTIYEASLSDIYNKAYKICRTKVDCAQTMISTLSKSISRRMSEASLSSIQPANGGKQVLNEAVFY